MSSIRKRLSQLWRRSPEKEIPKGDEQSTIAHRDSMSSLDSDYSSNTSHRATDSMRVITPRNLHKAASSTFQSFSDTIRSKTRVFYVSPDKADTKSYDHTEDTPKSHQPRSSMILSSVMNHERHGSLDYRLKSGPNSPTPMIITDNYPDMTPTINVKIPNSFLTDLEPSEDSNCESSIEMPYQATTPAKLKPYESRQLWPTPIDVALQQFSKIDLSTAGVPRSPMIDDPDVGSSEDFMYDSAMLDSVSHVPLTIPEDQNLKVEDNCGNGNLQDKAIVTELNSPALGWGSSPRPMINTDAAAKKQPPDYSLLTVSFLEPLEKKTNNAGKASEVWDSSPQPNQAIMPSLYSKTTQRSIFYRTLSHKTGLSDLIAASNSSPSHEGQEDETSQLSSSVYESDEESEAPSPEIPAMGSRRDWDKARADRYNRYSAIRSLDDDEKTEEDSDFGIELERSPARKPLEDRLRALVQPDTNKIGQGVDQTFANDEVADLQETSSRSLCKSDLHSVETTEEN